MAGAIRTFVVCPTYTYHDRLIALDVIRRSCLKLVTCAYTCIVFYVLTHGEKYRGWGGLHWTWTYIFFWVRKDLCLRRRGFILDTLSACAFASIRHAFSISLTRPSAFVGVLVAAGSSCVILKSQKDVVALYSGATYNLGIFLGLGTSTGFPRTFLSIPSTLNAGWARGHPRCHAGKNALALKAFRVCNHESSRLQLECDRASLQRWLRCQGKA